MVRSIIKAELDGNIVSIQPVVNNSSIEQPSFNSDENIAVMLNNVDVWLNN